MFFDMLSPFIPFLLFVLFLYLSLFLIRYILKSYRDNRKYKFQKEWLTEREVIDALSSLKPAEFEEYIATLYRKLGYKTKIVGGSHDGGVDVIAEKGGVDSLIQCKRYSKSKVTVHDVRDFYGALANKLSRSKGVFITTNIFTSEAEKFVENKPIELVDGHGLIDLIKIAENIPALDSTPKINEVCPECGGILTIREGKFGKFYGCNNFPTCTFRRSIK